ncbi:hypothetical protein LRP31_25480 [Mesorhizobium mediterraneum]|uniref:Uncharacterized protein n=1 Tax=Mesorhizobium mediterraneum TaxID=43617 RepID=A0AB36R9D6_9HYPH|nr:hypothetical protein [Mesorhizobium mediterraneum]PAQ00911.1 hypothetical protein CIT25_17750 [Mesorhizobium mediterraneum]WIW52374.1 hypothetical protein LRP31_25480 [Mesorhizobium mediterraneum]
MAYSVSIPPKCIVPGLGGAPALWTYSSVDVHTDVDGTDYFTNGTALGMKVGDFVLVAKTTATIGATMHVVTVATAGGAATVSAAILA